MTTYAIPPAEMSLEGKFQGLVLNPLVLDFQLISAVVADDLVALADLNIAHLARKYELKCEKIHLDT